MRHAPQVKLLAVFLVLTAALLVGNRLFAADQTSSATSRPSQRPYTPNPWKVSSPSATLEKLEDLGTHLGRVLDIAVDLLSGNQTDLLSKNKTALLSGNNPKVLSENTTPILSGNSFSLFSNIKVEIHIENSGNTMAAGATAKPIPKEGVVTNPEPSRKPRPR